MSHSDEPTKPVCLTAYNCGLCMLDTQETAMLLRVKPDDVCVGDLAADYMRGRLEGLLRIRQRLFDEADAGDMAAVKQYLQIYADTEPEIDEPEK